VKSDRFNLKYGYQAYQTHFAKFQQDIQYSAIGPTTLLVLSEDANGHVYSYRIGPEVRQVELALGFVEGLLGTPKKEEKKCFANKLKNGLKKLFN